MKRGKKYQEAAKLIEDSKLYDVKEAISLVRKTSYTKFDGSVELHVRLGVDSKQADQQVRGAVVLPNGTGKDIKIVVVTKEANFKAAQDAGADFVGGEDIISKIQTENWFGFDVMIATPDMMGVIGKIGKVLGPKGLMPNPKTGTVTPDVAKAVKDAKAGKVEYRLDKNNIIHMMIGKVSFDEQKIFENLDTVMSAIIKAKPAAAKGQYLKSISLASTMGPGVAVNPINFS